MIFQNYQQLFPTKRRAFNGIVGLNSLFVFAALYESHFGKGLFHHAKKEGESTCRMYWQENGLLMPSKITSIH
jgi:hypothetical protein